MTRATVVLLATLLAACSTPTTGITFYVVDPVVAEPLPGADPALAIQVTDLVMPQYLERFQLATRTGAQTLRFSDSHQWGETLRKNLLRTLARNLSILAGTPDVGTPLGRSASRPDVRVLVQVEAFERGADGRARLAARWQVVPAGDAEPRTARLDLIDDVSTAEGDWAAMVARMQDLFGRLSVAVAEDVLAGAAG